jgi:hypothetical protein
MQVFLTNGSTRVLLACGALLLGQFVLAGSAGADGVVGHEMPVSEVSEVVESVAGPVPPRATDDDGRMSVGIAGGEAHVPLEGDSMAIVSDDGPTVELGLPVEEGVDGTSTPVRGGRRGCG